MPDDNAVGKLFDQSKFCNFSVIAIQNASSRVLGVKDHTPDLRSRDRYIIYIVSTAIQKSQIDIKGVFLDVRHFCRFFCVQSRISQFFNEPSQIQG